MVILRKADLTNIISLRFPTGWYPGTSPLHSILEDKEWSLVTWRLCGVDWDELRSICISNQDTSDMDPTVFEHFFKRIKAGDGFSVFPHIPSYCIPPIPEIMFARSVDGKLPIHVAIDGGAPIDTLNMLLGKDSFLIHSYSDLHGLPAYYACHTLTSEIPLGRRVVVIDFLLKSYPHAAFIKSPNGDYPLHALMKNHPSSELVEIFLSIERDGSGKTVPLLGCLADNQGQVPLHIGLEFNAPEESIRALLKLNPQVIGHRRDIDGKIPLDLVNPSIIGDDVVAALLLSYDASCTDITYR
jgi:ankyrin repeat protein